MQKILDNQAVKAIALILCAVLPCAVAALFFGLDTSLILYNVLWCGFYGCVLVCLTFRNMWIKTAVIALNLLSFGFCAIGALMGGISAPFILLLKAVIPFMTLF